MDPASVDGVPTRYKGAPRRGRAGRVIEKEAALIGSHTGGRWVGQGPGAYHGWMEMGPMIVNRSSERGTDVRNRTDNRNGRVLR